ncbi:SEC-C metal-binding domain-containing protein, partial [Streptococcus mitis]
MEGSGRNELCPCGSGKKFKKDRKSVVLGNRVKRRVD